MSRYGLTCLVKYSNSQLASAAVVAGSHRSPSFENSVEKRGIRESAAFGNALNSLICSAQQYTGALDAAALEKADGIGPGDSFKHFPELHFAEANSLGQVGYGEVGLSKAALDVLKCRKNSR
jgi:hypothetical protein